MSDEKETLVLKFMWVALQLAKPLYIYVFS